MRIPPQMNLTCLEDFISMEFDENIAKLQGALCSLGARGMLNESGCLQNVVEDLKKVVSRLPDNDKAKVTFFMVLNTRISVSEKLKNDEFVSLFTNITPYIEKEYLVIYAYHLHLHEHLFRVIENCPGALGLELLEEIIKKVEEPDFHRDEFGIQHLYQLWQTVSVKIYKIQRGLHLSYCLEKFLSSFQTVYVLIQKVIITLMLVHGLEKFVGYHLHNFFETILFCVKLLKAPDIPDNPIYKLSVQLDNNNNNKCDIKKPINSCIKIIFDELFDILKNITVDMWLMFSEFNLNSDSRDSVQMLIGDLVYNILKEVKQIDVPPKVLNCLSSLAINKSDLIAKAGIDEIISNVKNKERIWFEALVKHPECLQKKSVECLISHLELANTEDLNVIANTSYKHLCNCKDDTDLDSVKQLFLAAVKRLPDPSEWLEKVFKIYQPDLLTTAFTSDELTEAFNKMLKDNMSDCDLICLCMQSPFETIKRICQIAVNGSQQTEFVIAALKLLKRPCSVSILGGFTLLDYILLKFLEEDLSERESQSFINLVPQLGRQNLLGPSFFNNLLKDLKEYLQQEELEKAVLCLEIVKVLLDAKLFPADCGAFLVFMSQVFGHLTWDLKSFSSTKADGRDLAGQIVALTLNGQQIDKNGADFQWARREILKSWEGNQAHFCKLWSHSHWKGSGKFASFILALAHSHHNLEGLEKVLIGVDRPSEIRASFVLSLFLLLPVLSFREWDLIFESLRTAFGNIYPGKCVADISQLVLELFGSSLRLLTLNLKREDDMYPCYKYCLRNFMRLAKRCCSETKEASLLRTLKRIIEFLGMIEDEENRKSCWEISSPVLVELIDLLKKKPATEDDGKQMKELLRVVDAEDSVAVALKTLLQRLSSP